MEYCRVANLEKLRQRIKLSGLSHEQIAQRVGYSRAYVDHLAVGRKHGCPEHKADLLAQVLGVPREELFTAPGPRKRPRPERAATGAGQ